MPVQLVAAEELDTLNAVAEASVVEQAGRNRRRVGILRMRLAVVVVRCVAVASVGVVADTVSEEVAVDSSGQEVAWLGIDWVVVVVVVLVYDFEVVADCDR